MAGDGVLGNTQIPTTINVSSGIDRRKLQIDANIRPAQSPPLPDRRVIRVAEALSVVIILTGATLAFSFLPFRVSKPPLMPFYGGISLIILAGVAALYRKAYGFYQDEFYALAAVGWIGNAAYIMLESFYEPPPDVLLLFRLSVYGFNLVTLLPFYVAGFKQPLKLLDKSAVIHGVGKWVGWLALSLLVPGVIIARYFSHLRLETQFVALTLGGVPFACWTLWRMGTAVRERLSPATHAEWTHIFPSTFYLYAVLQPLYVLKLIPRADGLLVATFIFALFLKALNGISAINIMLRDVAEFRQRSERFNVLEELGVLAASIEHDIKNPLQVIANHLDALREKLQANSEVLNRLDKVEHERLRIFATAEIVEMLRGGREYYEQFMRKTSVRDLINRSLKAIKAALPTAGIQFPIDSDIAFIKAYPPVLQQALVNVLKNSVEAIREAKRESGVVSIEVREKDNVTITISDNGCGVAPENIGKLGNLFSTKLEIKPNSGIGLFITSRIVSFHGGIVEIQSILGEGSIVTISIPAWRDEDGSPLRT